MQRQGITICLVSHDLGTVRRLCSRAVWLDEGAIQATGDVEDTISAYLHHAAAEEEARMVAMLREQGLSVDELARLEEVKDTAGVKRRWGTGDLRVLDVSFLNAAGNEQHVFRVGEPWIVRIRYQAYRRIEEPVFGLAVHRSDGLHVCGPNTHFAGLDIPFLEGEGAVFYRVDHLPLMEGTYLISVSAHNRTDTQMYDYHDRLYTFKVRQPGSGECYGLVSLGGEWSWNGDDGAT
jgi:hypothetical protein